MATHPKDIMYVTQIICNAELETLRNFKQFIEQRILSKESKESIPPNKGERRKQKK